LVQRLTIAFAALVSAAVFAGAPASAQDAGEKVNQLIVYGDDPCPQSKDDEITVCARKEEGERYRIPETLRETQSPENRAWTDRVVAYETVGSFGTMSCTPTGPGGMTGCLGKLIDTAYAEKKGDPNIRFSELIAAERAKRLSTIDADAADTQARVEQLEKEYEARQRARQDPEGGHDTHPAPPSGQ
jgi:hypothetical protein